MKKYKLSLYGWEVEAVGHSLTDKKVEEIQDLMKKNEVEELWEVRHELEDEEILPDWWSPDLFHETSPLDNSALHCYLYDEDEKEISTFQFHDIPSSWEVIGDDKADELNSIHCAMPEYIEGVDNVLCSFDENKGGLQEYEFESDTVPTPKDFYYTNGCIETDDGDWDIIDKLFFKGVELDISDWGDNMGKASTVEIYRKDKPNIT
jgi:hypothetical protein|tara:strand:- start:477 stop:1094 length:618 start_codon:yes stop_codon:yes gene_type:complete